MKVTLVNAQEEQDGIPDGRIKILICRECGKARLRGHRFRTAGVKTIVIVYKYYVCASCGV